MADTGRTGHAAYEYAYNRRPDVMEKKRQYSIELTRARRVISTKKRLMTHTFAELVLIAMDRCEEMGVDYVANKEMIEATLRILNGVQLDQSDA